MEAKFFLVEASVLPDVFKKVVTAKRLLAQGKAQSLSEATKMVELSRSAFYKYKDCVFPYEDQSARPIATIYAELLDEAGVLSSLLAELGNRGANILTINQNIPVDGVAPVSVSIQTEHLDRSSEELAQGLKQLHGVVTVRLLSTA